jgi:hypothetical protein
MMFDEEIGMKRCVDDCKEIFERRVLDDRRGNDVLSGSRYTSDSTTNPLLGRGGSSILRQKFTRRITGLIPNTVYRR